MQKSYIGGFVILCIIAISLPAVGAIVKDDITYFAINPTYGPMETKIWLTVRVDPGHTKPLYLCVLYDDTFIIRRAVPIRGTINSWNIPFYLPEGPPPQDKRGYRITILIDDTGDILTHHVNYFKVTNYIPPAEMWENLPQAFIDMIRGPRGDRGYTGAQGLTGLQGLQGEIGPPGEGIDGIDGINGTDGVDGIDGISPIDGASGIDGIDGSSGRDAPVELLYLSIVLSVVAIVGLIALWRRKA